MNGLEEDCRRYFDDQLVVVTGGAGFVGSHVCEALLGMGAGVVCVDNFLTGGKENIAHLQDHPGFRLLEQDVSEGLTVPGSVGLVLHLASPASPMDYLRHPVETMRAGSLGTLHCLELCEERGARFVLASTSEVYGDPHVHPQAETYWGNVNPIGPRSVYDEAKRFAEALTSAYRRDRGVDTGILRLFNVFGPRMRPGDGRAIPTFIRQALRGEPITVAGSGAQTRSVCFVEDAVRGILAVARSRMAGPVNIGNPDELSMLELAETIRTVTGSTAPITFVPRPEDDPEVRRPDITLARTALGWAPRISREEGLSRTISWFRSELLEVGR